ncbi:MAG: 30S ribosomal protein S16 [Chloroflexi bacterium]|nr:30S ribosomal protein S16 [Chloroflexota bacterium]
MLKIRLRRMGAIRQPHYRIVVADARAPRDGAFIETLGHYNPRTDPATIQIDIAKYEEWKKKGAQPTNAVASLAKHFNRAARKAAASAEAPQPTNRRTRNASGKGFTPPPAPEAEAGAEVAATEAAPEAVPAAEAVVAPEVGEVVATEPQSEGMAEATRNNGEGSEALTGATVATEAPDNSDLPVLEAATDEGSGTSG